MRILPKAQVARLARCHIEQKAGYGQHASPQRKTLNYVLLKETFWESFMPLTQRFKISPTSKGAIFKLKRWFYLNFFTKISAEVKERNKQAWLELSRRLIDEINRRGASDKPARITLEYEKGANNEFTPLRATVELMEIKPLEVFTIELGKEERKVEEKTGEAEILKAQLSQLLKKAQELGISVEELIKRQS